MAVTKELVAQVRIKTNESDRQKTVKDINDIRNKANNLEAKVKIKSDFDVKSLMSNVQSRLSNASSRIKLGINGNDFLLKLLGKRFNNEEFLKRTSINSFVPEGDVKNSKRISDEIKNQTKEVEKQNKLYEQRNKSLQVGSEVLRGMAMTVGYKLMDSAEEFVKKAIDTSNKAVNMRSQLNTLTTNKEAQNSIINDVSGIALETYNPMEEVARLYSRIGRTAGRNNLSKGDVFDVTDTIAKTLDIGGASTQERKSAMYQFSQAMASGVLQGNDLRALQEAAPVFLDYISKGSGIARGELKKMGAQGKLTTKIIVDALKKEKDEIDATFKKTNIMSIEKSMTNLESRFLKWIDKVEQKTGIFTKIANNIDQISKDLFENGDADKYLDTIIKLISSLGGLKNIVETLLLLFVSSKITGVVTSIYKISKGIIAVGMAGETSIGIIGRLFNVLKSFGGAILIFFRSILMKNAVFLGIIAAVLILTDLLQFFFTDKETIFGRMLKEIRELLNLLKETVGKILVPTEILDKNGNKASMKEKLFGNGDFGTGSNPENNPDNNPTLYDWFTSGLSNLKDNFYNRDTQLSNSYGNINVEVNQSFDGGNANDYTDAMKDNAESNYNQLAELQYQTAE